MAGLKSAVRRRQAKSNNSDVIFDAKILLKLLNELDPAFKKEMLREMKSISKPMVQDIKRVIPATTPFNSPGSGRLSYISGSYKTGGATIKPNNVTASFSAGRVKGFRTENSLFKVLAKHPMVAIIGTAGKGSGVAKYAVTREYAYKGGTRRHRNNGQGQAMINKIRSAGLYNFFWVQAEKTFPSVEREVKLVWEKYSAKVSRRL